MTKPNAVRPGDIEVQVLDGADEIDDADWSAVSSGCGFYSSQAWLRLLEDDPWFDVWYLAARGGKGELLGLLPLYLSSGMAPGGSEAYYDPTSRLFGQHLGDPRRWSPALLAGARTGYEGELLLRPEIPAQQRDSVIAALVGRLGRLTEAWDVRLTAFLHLRPSVAAQLAKALGATPLLTEATTVMDLSGIGSFDEYLAGLPKRRRARVRTELREFAGSDFVIRETKLADAIDVLAPLLAAHHRRYGHDDSPEMLAVHLRQQVRHVDEYTRVLLCERAGRTLGALHLHQWGDTWYARAVAADESLRGNSAAFFNLLYYSPLRMALQQGIGRYVLGPSTLAAKVWRGARVEPRWSLLVGRNGLEAGVARLGERWNAERVAHWTRELDDIGAGANVTGWCTEVGLPTT